eukprot:9181207-Ditylum_brightwellii.AAC.1
MADILLKEKNVSIQAKFLEKGIKPILCDTMKRSKYNNLMINFTCDTLTFKHMVIKKLHIPRSSVPIKCPIPGCKCKMYMQKKLFDVLPKNNSFQNHLDFGQDYMVWYQNEANVETSLSSESRKVPKFLNKIKKHFCTVHNNVLLTDTDPLVIRSSIFYCETLKKKGQPNHNMMTYKKLLEKDEEKKTADVAKGKKRRGRCPKEE